MLATKIHRLLPCTNNFQARNLQNRNLWAISSVKRTAKTSKSLVYCNRQITKHGRNGNINEAESIFRQMPTKNTFSYTALLSAYAQNGQIANARKLFDEIPDRDVITWNAMITAYVKGTGMLDGVDEAYRLFLQMPERDKVSYAAMVMGFVNAGRFDEAEKLYRDVPLCLRDPVSSNVLINGYFKLRELDKAAKVFEGMVEKDMVSCSSMVDGYCKNGRLCEARKFFDEMEEKRNEVSWCAMINGYMKMECFHDGFEMFLKMRSEGEARLETTLVTVIIEACGRYGRYKEGCQVHGLISRVGFGYDVFLGNSIITMYSRFGCTDVARNVFNVMNRKDVVTWNSLMYGYVRVGKLEEAYELFGNMEAKDSVSWTTMITGFSDKGLTKYCVELFTRMPQRDDVAWTALISGFVNNGDHEEAVHWFMKMLQNSVRPNPLTLCSLLTASSGLASLSQGLQVHAHAIKINVEFDLSLQNSLVSMYSKCGNINDAYKIFKSISAPNIVSINSMMAGFAQNGFSAEALRLFRQMKGREIEPNEITFLAVLSACTHGGLVEEGQKYFKYLVSSDRVVPGPDHYACMVDLLGRAGLLDEALNVIKSMPFEPHSGVWGALLGASQTHMHLDLAEFAARRILELEPNNAAPYVVLSDIYNFTGKRRDEEKLRLAKRLNGVKKNPGCSWITTKNAVHLFFAGDRSHVKFNEMNSMLLLIVNEMKLSSHLDMERVPP